MGLITKFHAEDVRKNGGVLYFIEHKDTHLWWHATSGKEVVPHLNVQVDGWTDDPHSCAGFGSKQQAQEWIDEGYWIEEPIENLIITDHEFVNNGT